MITASIVKHHQHFALFGITSLTFVSFYVSSLLFASLQDNSRLGLRRSFHSLLNPFLLKSAVKADFLTLEPKAWNESITLASTNAGGAGAAIDNAVNAASIALGVGMSRSKSDTSSTTYNNSSLIADSGTIKINTLNDATIKGANLLAQDVILNTGGDLTVASLQDSFQQKGSSFGLNLGGGASVSGGGSANFGINYGSSKIDRVWTDNQTSILGTNSVTINTANNTDIVGGLIANITNANEIGLGSTLLGGSESSRSVTIGNDSSRSVTIGNGSSRSVTIGNDSLRSTTIGNDSLRSTTKGGSSSNPIDGNNLTINTGSLTFQNLNNYSNSSNNSIGFQIGINLNSAIPNNIAFNYANNSSTKEGITKATIGSGNIKIGTTLNLDSNNNLISVDGGTGYSGDINRNINETQIVTKDKTEGGYDIDLNITPSVLIQSYYLDKEDKLLETGMKNLGGTAELYGNAVFGLGDGTNSADAVPGTLPWLSRWVNENNKVVKSDVVDGKIVLTATDYPAPNLFPGFGNEPIMGIAHKTCQGSLCYYLASDQAPLLKVIHQTFPGADSSSAFHDAGKYPNDPITTFVTIPPYFAVNIIGAIGTFFDVGNWKQNFVDPKTSIFTKPQPVIIQQPSNQIPSNQANTIKTNSNQQNGVKNE